MNGLSSIDLDLQEEELIEVGFTRGSMDMDLKRWLLVWLPYGGDMTGISGNVRFCDCCFYDDDVIGRSHVGNVSRAAFHSVSSSFLSVAGTIPE